MRTAQVVVKRVADLEAKAQGLQALGPNVVLVFGSVGHFKAAGFAETLRAALPNAVLIGCSTAGEITADGVDDDTCTLTGVRFGQTQIRVATTKLAGMDDSRAAGMRLGEQLQAADVQAVVPGRAPDQALIKQLVHLIYDVRRDDARFRARLGIPGSFDEQRKHYPERRELSSLQIKGEFACHTLGAAGFDISLS